MRLMTCMTEGCPSAGNELAVDPAPLDLETGVPLAVDTVMCGACSQPISDIPDVPTDGTDSA